MKGAEQTLISPLSRNPNLSGCISIDNLLKTFQAQLIRKVNRFGLKPVEFNMDSDMHHSDLRSTELTDPPKS